MDIRQELEQTKSLFLTSLSSLKKTPDHMKVEELRIQFLGRKGKVNSLMELLKNADKADRPLFGKAVNDLKQNIEAEISQLKIAAEAWQMKTLLERPALDVSMPVSEPQLSSSLHPVSLIRMELLDIFRRLGFSVYDGPEIDFDFYNFSALNIPEDHPARDMQDTFYLKGAEKLFLRTHTSNVQVHAMMSTKPPLRIVAPGRTYRVDNDPTHTPMFHQIEGFMVDEGISFAHLKGTLDSWVKKLFGINAQTRVRPSYFPFVEPGAEMDMSCMVCFGKDKSCRVCKGTGWLEIGGCGMIHPNVFESVGYDSERYTGFAFGFGLDRMAMLKYRIDDLRTFFDGSQEFLEQFPVFSR